MEFICQMPIPRNCQWGTYRMQIWCAITSSKWPLHSPLMPHLCHRGPDGKKPTAFSPRWCGPHDTGCWAWSIRTGGQAQHEADKGEGLALTRGTPRRHRCVQVHNDTKTPHQAHACLAMEHAACDYDMVKPTRTYKPLTSSPFDLVLFLLGFSGEKVEKE
jgi:hypothetical protein